MSQHMDQLDIVPVNVGGNNNDGGSGGAGGEGAARAVSRKHPLRTADAAPAAAVRAPISRCLSGCTVLMSMIKCPAACGGDLYFRPTSARFWTVGASLDDALAAQRGRRQAAPLRRIQKQRDVGIRRSIGHEVWSTNQASSHRPLVARGGCDSVAGSGRRSSLRWV